MKKIYYLFAIMTLSACESPLDELTRSPFSDDASPLSTRSVQFNPLNELQGIPVNIINYGNTRNKYLSARPSGTDVCLYDHDDGSLRQRWYIETYDGIYLAGGNSMTDDGQTKVVAYSNQPNSTPIPILMTSWGRSMNTSIFVNLNPINGTTFYNIWTGGLFRISPYYLQSSSQTVLLYNTQPTGMQIMRNGKYIQSGNMKSSIYLI